MILGISQIHYIVNKWHFFKISFYKFIDSICIETKYGVYTSFIACHQNMYILFVLHMNFKYFKKTFRHYIYILVTEIVILLFLFFCESFKTIEKVNVTIKKNQKSKINGKMHKNSINLFFNKLFGLVWFLCETSYIMTLVPNQA